MLFFFRLCWVVYLCCVAFNTRLSPLFSLYFFPISLALTGGGVGWCGVVGWLFLFVPKLSSLSFLLFFFVFFFLTYPFFGMVLSNFFFISRSKFLLFFSSNNLRTYFKFLNNIVLNTFN